MLTPLVKYVRLTQSALLTSLSFNLKFRILNRLCLFIIEPGDKYSAFRELEQTAEGKTSGKFLIP